jgi:peptide deformylase
MAVLPLVIWPDERLSQVCDAVDGEAADALAQDLLDTMYAAEGRGLAAPQVGVMRRIFVMDAIWKDGPEAPRVFINPEILEASRRKVSGEEGCLSIPDLVTEVKRHVWVRFGWTGLDGQRHEEKLTGFEAICVQHELDHLNGVVTFDRLSPDMRVQKEAEYKELCA